MLAVMCAIVLAGYLIRRSVQSIPTDLAFRRVIQSAGALGGLAGLALGLVFGVVVGGDLGGALLGALLHFFFRIPELVAASIGAMAFICGATALGSYAGAWCGKLIGRGMAVAASAIVKT